MAISTVIILLLCFLETACSSPLDVPHQDGVSTRSITAVRSPKDALSKSKDRGKDFLKWIEDPSKAGIKASTKWTDIKQITAHGWQIQDEERGLRSNEQPVWIRSLITPSRQGVHMMFRHDMSTSKPFTTSDGQVVEANYPPTNAWYDNTFWPDKKRGWIVAESHSSPNTQVAVSQTPQQSSGEPWSSDADFLPELEHVSDFWWFGWQKACAETNSKVAEIRGVLQRDIMNQETKEVLKHLLQKNGKPLPSWEHKVIFGPGGDEFEILVGTPAVRSVVFFAIQHRARGQLPALEIEKIAVYTEGGSPSLEVWLHRMS